MKPALRDVLKSAARLQAVVPDAVLVGGAAAAFHARHHYKRLSPERQSWEEVRNTCAALARAMVES